MSTRVGIQQFVSPSEPTGTQVGDEWFNSATNLLYKRTMIGSTLGWVVLGTANTTGTAGQVLGLTSAGTPGYFTIPQPAAATNTCAGLLVGWTDCRQQIGLGCQPVVAGCGTCGGLCNSTGCGNIAIGYEASRANTTGCHNISIGLGTNMCNNSGGCNVAVGHCALMLNLNGSRNTGVGFCALGAVQCGGNNTAIGPLALSQMTNGCYNVGIGGWVGNLWSLNNTCCHVAISDGAGTVRMSFTNTGALSFGVSMMNFGTAGQVLTSSGPANAPNWVTVSAGSSSSAGGGSGQFNTSISNQVGYALTDKLFDLTGVAGTYTNLTTIVVGTTATNGVAAVMPSTTGTRFVIHSIHITNTAASDAEVTGRFDHTQGFGGTATIQGSLIDHTSLFASRLPVPSGSAVELMKKPQVLNPNDWIRLQSTTPAGGAGINGALTAFIVYEESADWNYTGVGINLASTSPTTVYTSALSTTTNTVTATNYPSVIESVRVTNYSNAADYRVTVPWTNSAGTVQSYLAYNMLIPAFATVELLEKPKRITSGDIIKAIPEAPNVLSIQVSGKLITTTFV